LAKPAYHYFGHACTLVFWRWRMLCAHGTELMGELRRTPVHAIAPKCRRRLPNRGM